MDIANAERDNSVSKDISLIPEKNRKYNISHKDIAIVEIKKKNPEAFLCLKNINIPQYIEIIIDMPYII